MVILSGIQYIISKIGSTRSENRARRESKGEGRLEGVRSVRSTSGTPGSGGQSRA